MATELTMNVGEIDRDQRRALEGILGKPLSAGEQVTIRVVEAPQASEAPIATPSLPDYCNVFDGLSDQEVADLEATIFDRSPSRSMP